MALEDGEEGGGSGNIDEDTRASQEATVPLGGDGLERAGRGTGRAGMGNPELVVGPLSDSESDIITLLLTRRLAGFRFFAPFVFSFTPFLAFLDFLGSGSSCSEESVRLMVSPLGRRFRVREVVAAGEGDDDVRCERSKISLSLGGRATGGEDVII